MIKPASSQVPFPHLSVQQTKLFGQSKLVEHSEFSGAGPHSWFSSIGLHSFGLTSRSVNDNAKYVKRMKKHDYYSNSVNFVN